MCFRFVNKDQIILRLHVFTCLFLSEQVCRGCVQFLRLMAKRAVLDVEKLNPHLYTHIEELVTVKVRHKLNHVLSMSGHVWAFLGKVAIGNKATNTAIINKYILKNGLSII